MPIYEYGCGDCGLHTEVLQASHEAPLQICPACGSNAMQRLISNFGTQLPGLEGRQQLRQQRQPMPPSRPSLPSASITHSHGPACHHQSGFAQRLKQYEKKM